MPSKPSIPRTCQRCGRSFLAHRQQVALGQGKFCSRACIGTGPVERQCERCGKSFHATNTQIKQGYGKFCSRPCASRVGKKDAHMRGTVERHCEQCGRRFFRRPSTVALGQGRFCSRPCANRSRVGKSHGPLTPAERLWTRVHKTESCWIWTGTAVGFGYGMFRVNGKPVMTHNYSYELHNGPISNGLRVLHKCGNHPCVNPDHLFLGTHKDNGVDAESKERTIPHLTAEQVRDIRRHYIAGSFNRGVRQRERRAARAAAGLCRICGKVPPRTDGKECQSCIDTKRRSERALKDKRIRQNICAHCGKRPPKATSKVCEHCTPRSSKPRSAGGGTPERKRRVGNLKYLHFVEPAVPPPSGMVRKSGSAHYYLVEIRAVSRILKKVFTINKHGGREVAFLAALKWRDDKLDELGLPKDLSAPFFSRSYQLVNKRNQSTGIMGVTYSRPTANHEGHYCARWVENGKPRTKHFSVKEYGPEEALRLAIAYRRERVAEHYHRVVKVVLSDESESLSQFYSCFISYNHNDEDFTKHLHSQMQAVKLKAFYAPEHMKGGQKIYEQIDHAIKVHDRLLLVLSENSMNSEWVKTEIRRARKIEVEENRRKLFPISLVSYETIRQWECFDADTGKDLAVELREYHIPDFSDWRDSESFEKKFKKLLNDLKAE